MYPNLLLPLTITAGVMIAGVLVVVVWQPVSRRLALRQLARRRSEAALAIIGATLGTAMITGALVVGDTLNFSVRQDAYRTLGPIDERVLSQNPAGGDVVAARLGPLAASPYVDGVLSARIAQAAAVVSQPGGSTAEPRVLAWDLDFAAASRFGAAGGSSGLQGPAPGAGQVVLNQPLADSLHVGKGDRVSIYLFGKPYPLSVARIVPERGVAGAGLGAVVNRNAFLPPGLLTAAASATSSAPEAVTFVSNRGGVERGAGVTDAVIGEIRAALGTAGSATLVDTPKRDVLDAAKRTGDTLGALFLMIGSFSIIAGALLLVNIFVMLAEERKAQLGMLRAIGMRRSRLVGSFTLEGATYALASVLPGLLVGLGVGWAVAKVAAQIFRSFSASGDGLTISFAVTPTSLINAAALGLVIALATIAATSIRISRFNVIAAIRDLPQSATARARRLTLVLSTVLAVLVSVAAVPAVAASQAEASYVLPSAAAFLFLPALRRFIGARRAITIVAALILVWCLTAPVFRPHLFDSASMAVYVIEGSLVAFSAVALVSQNQNVVLAPIRWLFERPSESGVSVRLAVAYPLAKRFRTGATLVMYTLITLVLVLLVEISGVINASIDQNVVDATAGYSTRVDLNPSSASETIADMRSLKFARDIKSVTPLVAVPALATDPGHRSSTPTRVLAVGVPDDTMTAMRFTSRLPSVTSDSAVWQLVAHDPRYVVMDAFFGSTGGPNGVYYRPGDQFTITDPRTGVWQTRIIAGILTNALIFYPVNGDAGSVYPIVGSTRSVQSLFGTEAPETAALLRTRDGVDPADLAGRLQAQYLSASVVATPVAASVRRMFAANIAFFRLMQGFLGLGLFVGITGLGVVMVRAVRERRRTIGVLRALGFRARTVERSFLLESGLIALEGVLLGSVLGVLTTWLMYQKSAMFENVRGAFPIEWSTIGALAAATMVASLAATLAPARSASRIRPAIAVRVAD